MLAPATSVDTTTTGMSLTEAASQGAMDVGKTSEQYLSNRANSHGEKASIIALAGDHATYGSRR